LRSSRCGWSSAPSPSRAPTTQAGRLADFDRDGKLDAVIAGRDPPTASTVQTLTAKGKVLGRGRTTISAGQTKSLTLTLTRKARRSSSAPRRRS
jgi:hypothetical protein